MKRAALRKHMLLNQAAEGEWVWFERGFPPSRTRTTHKGRPSVAPVKSRSGVLEPPAVPSALELSRVVVAPTVQFSGAATQFSTNNATNQPLLSKRTYSTAAL